MSVEGITQQNIAVYTTKEGRGQSMTFWFNTGPRTRYQSAIRHSESHSELSGAKRVELAQSRSGSEPRV